MTAHVLPTVEIALSEITDAPRNPNRMTAHKYASLVAFMHRRGLAQPPVVHRIDDRWELVDGHHRVKAMREAGWPDETTIPCHDATSMSPVERAELSLSLNNNRGELDLTAVSHELDFLVEQGRTLEDLEIVGYTSAELEALVGATNEISEDDLLEDAHILEEKREAPESRSVFMLEIELTSADELKLAKSRLRKAGGKKNRDLARGLRSALGMDEDDG